MDTNEMCEKLLKFPGKIKKIETSIYNLKCDIDDLKLKLKSVEFEHEMNILNEVNENNKPVYSNVQSRDAEFFKRTMNDSKWNKLQDELKKKDRELHENMIEMKFWSKTQSGYEVVIKAMIKK